MASHLRGNDGYWLTSKLECYRLASYAQAGPACVTIRSHFCDVPHP